MDGIEDQRDGKLERLTGREREILRLVGQHLTGKEIGKQLGLSNHTVANHVRNALERLGVDDRRAAARMLLAAEDRMTHDMSGMTDVMANDPAGATTSAPQTGADHDPRQRPPHQHRHPRPEPGPVDEAGSGPLRSLVPARPADGDAAAGVDLGAAGATARQPLLQPGHGGRHARADLGGAQAVPLAAARDGAAGNPLRGLRGDGWGLLPAGVGGQLNTLGPVQRLGLIVLIMVIAAMTFGGALSGLVALQQLIRP
ncbi:MAG: LuxR family transcriptional regulator [Caulobacteraceae bacterium]|nr:MAG: LuxR family transcriptional regulator [Caulobacteraceae bacterium]